MKINIYYGGRGFLDDPTLYVLEKMQMVFEELNVKVERFNLFEQKNSLVTLPNTFKNADGIILASTVEWFGIGGYMQQFLDACWQYGDKEKISELYMLPVVMSTTYGEKEGELTLLNSWEILGGIPSRGMCGYVSDPLEFEMNKEYSKIIEKKAENFYRNISQKLRELPTSNQAVKTNVLRTKKINFTPQESEQLSKYVSDDEFVKTQKEDLKELATMFKDMLVKDEQDEDKYINSLRKHFRPTEAYKSNYLILVSDLNKSIVLEIDGAGLNVEYGTQRRNTEVIMKMTSKVFDEIIAGHMTFQRAFMEGSMSARGKFNVLRQLDRVFSFNIIKAGESA
ncbi:SCP-2 sterol transfer family protein [Acetitomaculum ruminis DSM 5522]|uniref:SCP-2 sterol transfer family protein n=1 Tax=Acetitomaculum ruminis DSM 5522 TaxID=1120918 RepID=A0A1I0ZCH3_9FIRM|nr:SCP2 sterol-binding domain-containing protein [Acetitomaculum ruminis]SFB23221.1 SCP-2 sterol transfer family protein [Acetitomaculum ruminis DSM 5522]